MPPYIINDSEIEFLVTRTMSVLDALNPCTTTLESRTGPPHNRALDALKCVLVRSPHRYIALHFRIVTSKMLECLSDSPLPGFVSLRAIFRP